MTRKQISDAVGNIDSRYIQEAANDQTTVKKNGFFRKPLGKSMIAAVLAACLLVAGISVISPHGSMLVTAYAYGTEEEITTTGVVMSTGMIDDGGKVTGHPLMFFLAGENIEKVRFSCKNQQINFMDWTEKRDEFGNAQNFTVPYGADESEYYFLLIDWVPNQTIWELTNHADSTIATLPAELREDTIVMEVTFSNRTTATRAITVTLRDDGTVFAVLDDYTVTEADDFVQRPDKPAIPREMLYEQAELSVVFRDKEDNEVLPDALWYNFAGIDHIDVQWTGAMPESVRVYYTPAGTETLEEMKLLQTKVPLDGNNAVAISLSDVDTEQFYGHLQIELDFCHTKLSSDLYNVFYDEAAQQEYEMILQAENIARAYYANTDLEMVSTDLVDYTGQEAA